MKQLKIEKQITNREDASLEKYLHDISKFSLLTADEEVVLSEKIIKGDQISLDKLINANLRFVVSVAKQYQNFGLSLVDLINEGNLGLVIAAQRFDPTRGFKFISYAVWWIRQSILQSIYEKAKTVRLPVNRITTINKINQIYSRLEQELGRSPSADEIAGKLNITIEEVNNSYKYKNDQISVDTPILEGEDIDMLDILQNDNSLDPELSLLKDSLKQEIKAVLAVLSPRESEVLRYYYGIDLEMPITMEEIAVKLGLTRERIRQIKECAIKRLKTKKAAISLRQYLG